MDRKFYTQIDRQTDLLLAKRTNDRTKEVIRVRDGQIWAGEEQKQKQKQVDGKTFSMLNLTRLSLLAWT